MPEPIKVSWAGLPDGGDDFANAVAGAEVGDAAVAVLERAKHQETPAVDRDVVAGRSCRSRIVPTEPSRDGPRERSSTGNLETFLQE